MYESVGKLMAASFLLLGIGITTAGIADNPDTATSLQKPVTDKVVENPETVSQRHLNTPERNSKTWKQKKQKNA